MTNAESWGGPARLSGWDAVMWRAEADPRTRSGGVLLEILDSEPEWDRFYAGHERAVAAIPRLRERIVEPLLPRSPEAWSIDPHFAPRAARSPDAAAQPGTERQASDRGFPSSTGRSIAPGRRGRRR